VTAAADPMGRVDLQLDQDWRAQSSGSSISEGIGQGRVTGNLDGAKIDDAVQIPDSEMLPVLYDLLQHEGLLLGARPASTWRRHPFWRSSSAPARPS